MTSTAPFPPAWPETVTEQFPVLKPWEVLPKAGNLYTFNQPDGPQITVRPDGRRGVLPHARPDGTIGLRRARCEDEQRLVSENSTVWSMLAYDGFWAAAAELPGNMPPARRGRGAPAHQPMWVRWAMSKFAGLVGSQNASVAYFSDPITWYMFCLQANHHLPEGWTPANPATPPTLQTLRGLNDKWELPEWEPIREAAKRAEFAAALNHTRRLGHFNPDQPLSYNQVDFKQWVIVDGTVLKAPSDRTPDDAKPGRIDPASGMHTHAGGTKRGSKFMLAETVSAQYRGRFIIAADHVTPKPGNTVGDEAATTITAMTQLKQAIPGMRGVIVDGAFRGTHLKKMYDIGLVTINRPTAASNPNRSTGGVMAEGREETKRPLRVHRHTLPNGYECEHRLHLVGSVLHQQTYGDDGNTILTPLPTPHNGYGRENRDGTWRWYTEYVVPCPNGDTTARLRLDAPGEDDYKGGSRPELARFYPTDSPQFGVLYGRRNATESVHRQYKRRAVRVPAYGHIRQTLYVLGFVTMHNAVAVQMAARAAGEPNVFGDKRQT